MSLFEIPVNMEVVAVAKRRLLLQSELSSFLLTQYYGH